MFRLFRHSFVFLACALAMLAAIVVAADAVAAQSTRFIPPVDAPIRDPYRPPSTPYGPGNRGIEYATEPGTPVRAAADGVVAFAGTIAHERHVSIDHAGGIRTSYSYLATIDVRAGQLVAQGDVIGSAGDRLHFGARRDGVYFDPASLFAAHTTSRRARLVPVQGLTWT